jgi:CBS domain-containing protein
MITVEQVLSYKGRDIVSVDRTSTVYAALELMADRNIGSVAVVKGDQLIGIFTERDYARKVVLKGKASPTTSIAEVMVENPICVLPEQTVEQCMAVMTEKAIRHLPVLDHNRIVGIVSIGDLVKSIIHEQKFIIEQLEHYIQGV